MSPELSVRRAAPADTELVVSIITPAFAGDPLWSHALARPDGDVTHHAEFWRVFVDAAIGFGWTWLADGGAATSIWIPPDEAEMSIEHEEELVELARRHLGEKAADYQELSRRFDEARPTHEPHYYLSFVATHPDHRGHGIGMSLLARNLELIDAEGYPAYLESSNPDNDARYASLGFEAIGTFSYPGGGPRVTTMWRPAR